MVNGDLKKSILVFFLSFIVFVVVLSLFWQNKYHDFQLNPTYPGANLVISETLTVGTPTDDSGGYYISISKIFERYGEEKFEPHNIEIMSVPMFVQTNVEKVYFQTHDYPAYGSEYSITYYLKIIVSDTAIYGDNGDIELAFNYPYFRPGLIDFNRIHVEGSNLELKSFYDDNTGKILVIVPIRVASEKEAKFSIMKENVYTAFFASLAVSFMLFLYNRAK